MSKRKDLATRYAELKKLKDELAVEMSKIEKELKTLDKKLVDEMQSEGLQSFKDDQFGTFFLRTSTYTKIEDESAVFKWLEDDGQGDLIKRQIHPSSLTRAVKDELQKNGKRVPGVKVTHVTKVVLQKGKKS